MECLCNPFKIKDQLWSEVKLDCCMYNLKRYWMNEMNYCPKTIYYLPITKLRHKKKPLIMRGLNNILSFLSYIYIVIFIF